MPSPAIICSNLTFAWPDETPVFQDLSFAVGGGRTGLVALNGAGKSTLLKLIAGEYQPSSGSVAVDGAVGYLPQSLPLTGDLTAAHVLGIEQVLRALVAIEAGDVSEEVFAAIGSDWDIEERTRAQLDRLDLADIAFDRQLWTMSGGQIVSLGLAAQLLKQPDVLLLDEPTNNLDLPARRRLGAVLQDWNGCLLLVSHDRELLDRMDRIAELHQGEIRFYGGNFTEYQQALDVEREVAEKNIRTAEQDVKREKREMQQARERAAKRSSTAARNIKSAGLPKIVAGALKRSAQESAGRSDGTHSARLSDATARLDAADRALRDDPVLALELPDTKVPAGRNLFIGSEFRFSYGDRVVLDEVTLIIRGPERIALTGPNGAGKSTLLKVISGELEPDTGVISGFDGRIAVLSQRLDLLDRDRSVLQNFESAAPTMLPAERMNLLARFLFRGTRVHLPVRVLSGGERLRATLACVLHAQPAPQLLLLDEPTNNLDLVSVSQLESALRAYQGAFVVISHDERFLAEIAISRWLSVADGQVSERSGYTSF